MFSSITYIISVCLSLLFTLPVGLGLSFLIQSLPSSNLCQNLHSRVRHWRAHRKRCTMGDVYRQMDLLWDARAAVEGLLEKHLLVIIGVFFSGIYPVSPLNNFPDICLGDGQWGGHRVLVWAQELKVHIRGTIHLIVLPSALSLLSLLCQSVWSLCLKTNPKSTCFQAPLEDGGKQPCKMPGCRQVWRECGTQLLHTQTACLVPSFLPGTPGAIPLSLRGSAGSAVTPDAGPLLPALQTCRFCSAMSNALLRPFFTF